MLLSPASPILWQKLQVILSTQTHKLIIIRQSWDVNPGSSDSKTSVLDHDPKLSRYTITKVPDVDTGVVKSSCLASNFPTSTFPHLHHDLIAECVPVS